MKIKILILALLVSACCDDNDKDCSVQELANKKMYAERDKSEAEAQRTYGKAVFVTQQDGVRLYKIWTVEPHASDHWTYFTTPCGDVSNLVQYQQGKARRQTAADVEGTGCK